MKFLSDLQRLAFTSLLQPKRIRSYIDFSEVCLSRLMRPSYLQIIEYLNKAPFDIKLDSGQTNNMAEGRGLKQRARGRAGVTHNSYFRGCVH